MQIKLIWAQSKHRVIGKDGRMPWHLPEDLAHFKRTTLNHPVIMGRKTWNSLPAKFRPLPGRLNIVISSQAAERENLEENGAKSAPGLIESLSIAEQTTAQEVWVIGGAQVYAQALPLAQELVVTEIDAEFAGDAFAPKIDAGWLETAREQHKGANGLSYSFIRYLKSKT